MASYKPPAETFLGKILKNATVLFFIVIVGLFAGTFFFLKANRNKADGNTYGAHKSGISQRQYIRDEAPDIQVTTQEKGATPDTTSAAQTADASSTVPKDIKDQSADEIRQDLENQLFKKDPAGTKTAGESNRYELKVYYAEVSAKGMDMLLQEARANGHSSNTDFAQGIINLPMAKLLSYRDEFSVYHEVSKAVEQNKTADWFQGLKSAGQDGDIGLSYSVQIKEGPNNHPQIEVKVSKKFQVMGSDGTKTPQSMDFVGGGEVDKDQTYFAAEILSKDPMSPQQEYLVSMSPFEIYKSQNFMSGKTFSVFFYTVENK